MPSARHGSPVRTDARATLCTRVSPRGAVCAPSKTASRSPRIDDVFAEGVHVLDLDPRTVIEDGVAVPKPVHLVGLHPELPQDDDARRVVEERGHGGVESAILRDEVPGLHPAVPVARELLHVHGAYLVRFAVIEEAGLRGIGLVAYLPRELEPETLAVDVGRAVAPIPDVLVRPDPSAPVQHAERRVAGEGELPVPPCHLAVAGH